MRTIRSFLLSLAVPLGAAFASEDAPITIIGEAHDNQAHHAVQAQIVDRVRPAALVFEMVRPEVIYGRALPEFHTPGGLPTFLEWDDGGWPDFEMYRGIFAAAENAMIYGAAVPREVAYGVVEGDLASAFSDAAAYGLDRDLPIEEQAARQAMQFAAHCEALPEETLPGMVNVQRLRDATMARAALQALADTGGPVVVITGNGHARRDWGIPRYLARVAPEVSVHVIGQGEGGRAPEGAFDVVVDAEGVDRPDPCAAFK